MGEDMNDQDAGNKVLCDMAVNVYGQNWVTPLAREIGYTPQSVNSWKRGERPPPVLVMRYLSLKARQPVDLPTLAAEVAGISEALQRVAARLDHKE